jgi:hypothetical protein
LGNLWHLEALAVLLAIVPGYLAVSFWRRAKTWQQPSSDLGTLLPALAVSLVIQVVVSPLTIWLLLPVIGDLLHHPWNLVVWTYITVIVVPFVGGVGLGRLTDLYAAGRDRAEGLAQLLPEVPPSAWDLFFSRKIADGQFLMITFEDGSRVGGSYYGPSFALKSPQQQGLYLAREWVVDAQGHLDRPVLGSKGILIPTTATIRHVRVIEAAPSASGAGEGASDGPEEGEAGDTEGD